MTGAPILVAGGGIAGLATALSLRARGVACTVMESAREIVPLGVGINLLPHGVRVLAELGLAEALAQVAIETRAVEYRTRDGRLIHADPRGAAAGLPFPQYSVHRGNLHAVLYRALLERHGEDAVRAGARLIGVEADGERVRVRFEDRRRGGAFEIAAAALIGADGILSVVRAGLRPDEGPPRGPGIVLYRGLSWARPIHDGRTVSIAGVPGHKVVLYPVRAPRRRDGLQLVNWLAEHGGADGSGGSASPGGDWNAPVDRERVATLFADLRFDFADVPALIRGSEVCLSYPLVDRDPIDAWVHGRVALVGDAAHPMFPSGENGSSQALLDAEAIAECIVARPGDLPGALRAYETRRLARANAVVLASRERGPERLLALADERIAAGCVAPGAPPLAGNEIDAVMRACRHGAGVERDELAALAGRPRLWPRA
jgi:2-polyprenyl-6-methoxyphenol hydroxylase-like FAD-dependent oxidoreductase